MIKSIFFRRPGIFFFTFSLLLSPGIFAQSLSAQFTAITPSSGCSPLIVQFSDQSTGSPTSWLWKFGNGNVSTEKNPSAIYVTPGLYPVTLIVSKPGATDSLVKNSFITVFANPVASFTANKQAACPGTSISFSDLSSKGDANITSWLWDFGDGSGSTVQNPAHTFSSAGKYAITLVARDANGCQQTISVSDYITITQPAAGFSGTPLSACTPPLNVIFSNASSGSGLTYLWDFGDGASSSAASPSHLYAGNGNYHVKLGVTDAYGCKDSTTKTNYVSIQPLAADFSAPVTSACDSLTVQFSDLTTPVPTYRIWSFGDGATSTVALPSHTYSTPGSYTVSLAAANNTGCSDTLIKNAYINIFSPVSAGFTADTLMACSVPFTVNFSDTTAGAASWLWDFGDGQSSTQQNPQHTYTIPGQMTVRLIVSTANGCGDTLTQTNFININPPVADFGSDKVAGCMPLPVTFSDQSISTQSITSWQWNFGDGATSTSQNPSHTYATEGTFDVRLVVTNAWGCKDTLLDSAYISAGIKPAAAFGATPLIGCLDSVIQFNDASTGGATRWLWNFGDGASASMQDPTHQYGDTGTYDITLVAIRYGCRDTLVKTKYVTINPPVARFSVVKNCSTPFDVSFADNSVLPESWLWDFGDGTTSTAQSPLHTYVTRGTYNVSLVVTNTTFGCSNTSTMAIPVTKPEAGFSATPDTGCFPLNAAFTDTSRDAAQWYWYFGNTDTSTQQNPFSVFTTPGNYPVKLVITDVNNCKDSIEGNVKVLGPVTLFGANPRTGCVPLSVMFTDSAVSDTGIATWTWSFGDGTTSAFQNPGHAYQQPGLYTVMLAVTDSNGCVAILTKPDYIESTFPQTNFTADKTAICEGGNINFTNSTVGKGVTYLWNFGDGSTSTQQNPSHTYATKGFYTVMLMATDTNGCDSTLVRPAYIDVQDPAAAFGTLPTYGACPPLAVSFSDSSTGGAVAWNWDFGDGSGSTLQNPSHVYAYPGLFDVKLVVATNAGCTDTLFKPGLVNVLGPYGTFTFSPDSGCSPLPVQFGATATNTIKYTWDFGDGNLAYGDSSSHTYIPGGVYHPVLILEDNAGCKFIVRHPDSVIVTLLPVSGTADAIICPGTSVSLTVSGGTSYRWTPSAGLSNDTIANPVAKPVVTTSYIAEVKNAGCISYDTIVVNIDSTLNAAFVPDPTQGFSPLTVSFLNTSIGASFNQWSFGDGNTSTQINPSYFYADSGSYRVRLVVSGNGCTDTAWVTILVEDSSEVNIPNIFSPNGDGVNDVFAVKMTSMNKVNVKIFNRWGLLIYMWDNTSDAWNGRTLSGRFAPDGVYYYVITAEGKDKVQHERTGHFTLKR